MHSWELWELFVSVLLEVQRAAGSLRAVLAEPPLLCVLLGQGEKATARRSLVGGEIRGKDWEH